MAASKGLGAGYTAVCGLESPDSKTIPQPLVGARLSHRKLAESAGWSERLGYRHIFSLSFHVRTTIRALPVVNVGPAYTRRHGCRAPPRWV
jgi:hypothetical protein